jgi:hypothetical protein
MLGVLAACQDSEAEAERHFQNAMALMEEGDTARAAVEFRNVFQNNGLHVEARANFAAMLRREGDTEGSYSQYLRLAEQQSRPRGGADRAGGDGAGQRALGRGAQSMVRRPSRLAHPMPPPRR